MKRFFKPIDKEGALSTLKKLFSQLSKTKKKASHNYQTSNKVTFNNPLFKEKLNDKESIACNCFVSVVMGFLGNKKHENYKTFIDELLKANELIG